MKQKEYDRLVRRLVQLKALQAKYETLLAWKPSYINDDLERKYEQALDRTKSEIWVVMDKLDNCVNDSETDSFIPKFE